MSMYTLLRNNPLPTQKEMESAFEGMYAERQQTQVAFPLFINTMFISVLNQV